MTALLSCAPRPVAEPPRSGFAKLVEAVFEEVCDEDVGAFLDAFTPSIPACKTRDVAGVVAGTTPVSRLVLRASFEGSRSSLAVTDLERIGTSHPSDALFCDPLDRTEVFSPWESDDPRMTDIGPAGVFQAIVDSDRFATQFVSNDLVAIVQDELSALIAALPMPYRRPVQSFRIVPTYERKIYNVRSDSAGGLDALPFATQGTAAQIGVSAFVFRHVVITEVLRQEHAIRELEQRIREGMNSRKAIRSLATIAQSIRKGIANSFAFALAHELAHHYLATENGVEVDETRVDCFAIWHLRRRKERPRLGLADLVFDSDPSKLSEHWNLSSSNLEEVRRRGDAIRRLLAAPERATPHCD